MWTSAGDFVPEEVMTEVGGQRGAAGGPGEVDGDVRLCVPQLGFGPPGQAVLVQQVLDHPGGGIQDQSRLVDLSDGGGGQGVGQAEKSATEDAQRLASHGASLAREAGLRQKGMKGRETPECSAVTVASGGASRLICSASSRASPSLAAPTTRNFHRRTTIRPSLRSLLARATAS